MPQSSPPPGYESMPYRPCVGIALFNAQGRVFIARRHSDKGPEYRDAAHEWQMPQGGIDEGEDAYKAALRELYEETNIRSTTLLAEAPDWYRYDLPLDVLGHALKGRYRGQTQKWFALRFTGDESEIDVRAPGGGKHKPEFVDWRWEKLETLPGMVVPFKRGVYEQVVDAFRPFTAN
jgi:putative (di)nucleoside polyphosphate hydrolase